MAEHRVFFQGVDIFGESVSSAQREVSLDNGNTWRSLTPDEKTNGVKVSVGQVFVARLSRQHYWSVQQALVVTGGANPMLQYAGPIDFGSEAVASTAYDAGLAGIYQYTFTAWLTLFREAESARAVNGCEPIAPWPNAVMTFEDVNVLSSGGVGWGRFAGQLQVGVPSHIPGTGTLRFARTPDSSVPQLAAVFVPTGVELSQPLPMHIFFTPSTTKKKPPYPYSRGVKSYNDMLGMYLTNPYHRLINQCVAARRRCIFVFPLPPPAGYYNGVTAADRLKMYGQELAFWLKKAVGGQKFPDPRLGRCALSAFSEGGVPFNATIQSITNGVEFPELAEAYCFDVDSPAGTSKDPASYQDLLTRLGTWVSADPSRRVRMYTQYWELNQGTSPAVKGALVRSNGGAQEYQANQSTFVYTPPSFWDKVKAEQANAQPNPQYPFNNYHHLMLCFFMEHAVGCSGFEQL